MPIAHSRHVSGEAQRQWPARHCGKLSLWHPGKALEGQHENLGTRKTACHLLHQPPPAQRLRNKPVERGARGQRVAVEHSLRHQRGPEPVIRSDRQHDPVATVLEGGQKPDEALAWPGIDPPLHQAL